MIPKGASQKKVSVIRWLRIVFCALFTFLLLNLPQNSLGQQKYDIVFFAEKEENLDPGQNRYINLLNEEIIDLMRKKGIPFVKEVDMPKGYRSFLKDHEVRFYIKVALSFTHAGVGMQVKFIDTNLRDNSGTLKETTVDRFSVGFAANNLSNDLTKLKREFASIIFPTIIFVLSKEKGESLLASCIWPDDIDDNKLKKSCREVTIHYHEHLQTINPDNKYLIKGIDRTEFIRYCLGTKPDEIPLKGAYDHIVYGYLTVKGTIDLYWEKSNSLIQNRKEMSLQASTDAEIAKEIAQKFLEIAPTQ